MGGSSVGRTIGAQIRSRTVLGAVGLRGNGMTPSPAQPLADWENCDLGPMGLHYFHWDDTPRE